MQSCAWINGKYLQVGPPTQSSQAASHVTHDTMWNQQEWTASNSSQRRTSNTGVQPPQSAHYTFRDGAYSNGHMSNFQTLAVPHQAISSHQLAEGETNTYYNKVLHGNRQNSFANTQSENPLLLNTNGLRVTSQQSCYRNSGSISPSTQSPSNMMKAKSTYPPQDMSRHWNQQGIVHGKQSGRTQYGNVASDFQRCSFLKNMLQNGNGEPTKPVSAYTTTATSLPYEQAVCTSTLVSTTAPYRQTAQSFRNKSLTTSPSSSEQVLHISSTSPKTQQYPFYLSSKHNRRKEATRHFLSKAKKLPLNPATTQEQMLSPQMIARIVDNPSKSFSDASDGCSPVYTSSSYRGKQFVCDVKMTDSNENMRPVTSTVTDRYNSKASQSLTLNSELSLQKTTHSVMSRTQHTLDVPQQCSVPNVFSVTATADESGNGGNVGNVVFPKSSVVSERNQVGSLTDASQLMKYSENISPQRDKTESSIIIHCDMFDMLERLFSVNANDASIHSSPGHTGKRAIAVVQPLSQESYQVSSKQTSSDMISQSAEHTATDESLSDLQEAFISTPVAKNKKAPHLREGSDLYQENPNQIRSNKSISHSAASNDGTFVSSSDSDVHQDVSQELCTDDTGSEIVTNMQADQPVAPSAQQSTSEVLVNQSGDKDQSEDPTDPKAFELSSVPAIPWTTGKLIKLIQDDEKAQMKHRMNLMKFDSANKLLSLFWNGDIKNLACKLKTGWYKDLMADTTTFCSDHVTSDSVILSQVKPSFGKQLSNYHILKHNTAYSELPYKSSWLNVNEQLDDIDKEFGFPVSLSHRLQMIDSLADQVRTANSNLAQILSEVANKGLSQTELESVDIGEEKQASTMDSTSTQAAFPNETDSPDSSDPYYSFEIQVLPPEEAKRIFEQVQGKMSQSNDTDNQSERITDSSVEDVQPKAIDVATCSQPELCNELSQTTALTDNDHKTHSEVYCIRGQFKSAGGTQSCASVSSGKESENLPSSESEVASQISELGGQTQMTCTDEAVSLVESEEEQTQISAMAAIQTTFSLSGRHETVERKRKRLSNHDRFFPSLTSKKCKPSADVDSQPSTRRKVLIDTTDSEPLASNTRPVQLVLFGSAPQDTCFLNGSRKKHVSSSEAVSYGLPRPPEVLTTILSPPRKPSEPVPAGKYSVKRWIQGKRRSFPPPKIRCRNKLKSHKRTIASLSVVSLKKAQTFCTTNTEELPVSSERRIWKQNTQRCLSLRRRTLYNGLKPREERTKKDAITLKQPADQEGSNSENGSQAVIPRQDNYVLSFKVLPKTFNFKDISNARQDNSDHAPNKRALVEGKHKQPNITAMREKRNKHK